MFVFHRIEAATVLCARHSNHSNKTIIIFQCLAHWRHTRTDSHTSQTADERKYTVQLSPLAFRFRRALAHTHSGADTRHNGIVRRCCCCLFFLHFAHYIFSLRVLGFDIGAVVWSANRFGVTSINKIIIELRNRMHWFARNNHWTDL